MSLYPALTKDMTMAEAFGHAVALRGDQEALVCGQARTTYRQLAALSERLALGLARHGVRKGDHVAALLEPGPLLAALFFAVARLGAVMIPVYTQLRPQGVAAVLEHARPRLLVTDRALPEEVLGGSARPAVIYAEGVGQQPTLQDFLSGLPVEPTGLATDVAPTDLLALLYTSGTTGTPKATMHSHRSLIAPVIATLRVREFWMRRPSLKALGQMGRVAARYRKRLLRVIGQPQTLLASGGWHNTTGLEAMLQALLMGERLVVLPHFEPRTMMRLIEAERVTILVAVPMIFQVLLSLPDFEQYDTSSLLICATGAAPCPPSLAREIQRRFGCAVHIGFGATETGGGISVTNLADSIQQQTETVGRPLPGMEVRIVDDERRPLPPDTVGELAVRSDSVMLGYYRAPELTAEVLDAEGWYYTGDLAVLSADGYLRIVGRKRDLIIRGGQNIFPQEIEHYLVAHPLVSEAAVVGVPSPVGGESVIAFVIPEPGAHLTPQDVLAYCRAGLETYQIPAQVRLVDDFPRAATGKPQKHLLRAQALANLEGGNPT